MKILFKNETRHETTEREESSRKRLGGMMAKLSRRDDGSLTQESKITRYDIAFKVDRHGITVEKFPRPRHRAPYNGIRVV